jgi:hypothetical protein
MTRKLVVPFFVMTLGVVAICTPMFAHPGTAGVYDFTHSITPQAKIGANQCRVVIFVVFIFFLSLDC